MAVATLRVRADSNAPSDFSLLRRLRDGNGQAAEQLYRRYAQRLHLLAKAKLSPDLVRFLDADDLVQSVFRRFFQAAGQGNYDSPTGEDLWNLFVVIALNRIRSEEAFQRAAKRNVRLQSPLEGGRDAQEPTTKDGDREFAHMQLVVQEALAHLPDRVRDLIDLRLQGYEVAEIAQHTGRSKRTVERLMQVARQFLRDFFEKQGGHGN